jgi:hypothetical protein
MAQGFEPLIMLQFAFWDKIAFPCAFMYVSFRLDDGKTVTMTRIMARSETAGGATRCCNCRAVDRMGFRSSFSQ